MTIESLNAWIAGAVAFLAIGTMNRMNGKTAWSVRYAVLMIFVAMVGQSLGYAAGAWDHYCDTLAFAGIASFLLACRRNPIGIPWPWNAVASYGVTAGTVMIVFPFGWVAVLGAIAAHGYKQRDALARYVEDLLYRYQDNPTYYALRIILVAALTVVAALAAIAILPGCTSQTVIVQGPCAYADDGKQVAVQCELGGRVGVTR